MSEGDVSNIIIICDSAKESVCLKCALILWKRCILW